MGMKLLILLFVGLLFTACKKETVSSTTNDSISVITTKASLAKADSAKVNTDSSTIKNQSLEDLFKANAKPVQSFVVDASKDITLTCKEGTKISIKANSLIDEKTGKIALGKIKVFVTEYYTISDMLLAKLSTTSDRHLLESGGMLKIEAFANGEKLKLKDGLTATIEMPAKKKKNNNMLLFNGVQTKNGINWKLAPLIKPVIDDNRIIDHIGDPPIEDDPIIDVPQQTAQYPGGMTALYEFLNKTIIYPAAAKEAGVQGRVIISFVVLKTGDIADIRVLRGVDEDLNTEAVRVIQSMPKWAPAQQGVSVVKSRMTLPIVFRLSDDGIPYEAPKTGFNNSFKLTKPYTGKAKEYMDNKEANAKALETVIRTNTATTTTENINAYIFQTTKLGWINCDQFTYYPNLITYKLKCTDAGLVEYFIVFKKINALISTYRYDIKNDIPNLPLGEAITIIAIKKESGKNYIAVKETTITKEGATNFDFKPLTLDLLKSKLSLINR